MTESQRDKSASLPSSIPAETFEVKLDDTGTVQVYQKR